MTKIQLLADIFMRYGDFYIYRKTLDTHWGRWILFSEAKHWQKNGCNLRSIHDCEIVLDIDIPDQLDEVIEKLDNENYSYILWSTGSKGYHIHLIFPELSEYSESDRRLIRKFFIQYFECDTAKQTGMIAIENEPHFKTGNPKKIVKVKIEDSNKIPGFVLVLFKNYKAFQDREKSMGISHVDKDWVKKDPVVQYCLNHQIKPGIGRYEILIKNLAIGAVRADLEDIEIESLFNSILENMPERSWDINSVWGFVRAARNGQYENYNRRELAKWFREHESDMNE